MKEGQRYVSVSILLTIQLCNCYCYKIFMECMLIVINHSKTRMKKSKIIILSAQLSSLVDQACPSNQDLVVVQCEIRFLFLFIPSILISIFQ